MTIDERLVQYRAFLDEKIEETEPKSPNEQLQPSRLKNVANEAYVIARAKLYEIFPKLKH